MDAPRRAAIYAENAEKSVLGSMLLSHNAVKRAQVLAKEDFYSPAHAEIFDAMTAIIANGLPVDLVTLDDELQRRGTLAGIGGLEYLIDISRYVPSAANVSAYIAKTQEASTRRRLLALSENMSRMVIDQMNGVEDIAERVRAELRNVSSVSGNWIPMSDVLLETYNHLEKRFNGEITTTLSGIRDLDEAMGGFAPGELTIIASRPSRGKSAIGMYVAIEAAQQGRKVCFSSLEMVDVEFGQRILSNGSGVNGMKLRKAKLDEDDWKALAEAMLESSELPISFNFRARKIEEIAADVRKLVDDGKCDMLIVDYLQLFRINTKVEADRLRVEHISRTLQAIAKECKIAVIALAQVKRVGEGQRERCPTLNDLKDSGAIEQDADNVIFLHRPDDETDNTVHQQDKPFWPAIQASGYQYIVLSLAKQRQGQTGYVYVYFDPAHMRYYSIDRAREAS